MADQVKRKATTVCASSIAMLSPAVRAVACFLETVETHQGKAAAAVGGDDLADVRAAGTHAAPAGSGSACTLMGSSRLRAVPRCFMRAVSSWPT